MKKLQIMAWVLSALLLTGCGGSGTPTNTDNLPQTSATDASETTTTQNGNEYASEEATPGQDEKSGASDAAPGQVAGKGTSAGDANPAAGAVPASETEKDVPSKSGSAGGGASDSAGSGSPKPARNEPSAPAEETPAPQPEEKGFDIDYWLAYAKDCAVSIGLVLDQGTASTWDTPIQCSSKTEDVLAAYIRDDLTYYKNEEGCTAVWIWAEQVEDGQYELFIGRG